LAVYLMRATLPNISGMARDEVVNDFVFNAPSTPEAAVLAVKDFYNVAGGGATNAVGAWLGSSLSRTTPFTISTYDITAHLNGSPHGSPISVDPFTLISNSAAPSLPDQIAVVLSYHAAYGGALETGPSGAIPTDASAIRQGAPATHTGRTRPKSSLRGRLYVGPLVQAAENGVGQVSVTCGGDMAKQAVTLMTAALGWCVWSRRTASVHNIIGGWTDWDFGVQRRRNVLPRQKVPWPLHP
jgi:hypothetical protein